MDRIQDGTGRVIGPAELMVTTAPEVPGERVTFEGEASNVIPVAWFDATVDPARAQVDPPEYSSGFCRLVTGTPTRFAPGAAPISTRSFPVVTMRLTNVYPA